jgi:hypothetical protein
VFFRGVREAQNSSVDNAIFSQKLAQWIIEVAVGDGEQTAVIFRQFAAVTFDDVGAGHCQQFVTKSQQRSCGTVDNDRMFA